MSNSPAIKKDNPFGGLVTALVGVSESLRGFGNLVIALDRKLRANRRELRLRIRKDVGQRQRALVAQRRARREAPVVDAWLRAHNGGQHA